MLSQQRWLENKSQTLSVIKTKDKMSESQNRCTTFTKKRKETNFFLLMKMHDFIFKLSFSYNKEKICTKNKRLSTSTWNRTWKCQYKGNSSSVWLADLASINVLQALACQNSWMLKLILKCAWLQLYISVVSSLMPLFQKPLLLHFYSILLCSY